MSLSEFLLLYDYLGSVVLLEGKRKVFPADEVKLISIGSLLAEKSSHITFRSGNASGADELFSKGVALIDANRLQVITPFEGHRKTKLQTKNIYSLSDINLAEEEQVVYQSKNHKGTKNLVDRFVAGEQSHYALKAAYIIRDTVKVLGAAGIAPTTFALFYDDLKLPMQGGTGHTISVCKENSVPFALQNEWLAWLE